MSTDFNMLSSLVQSYTFLNDAINDMQGLRAEIDAVFAWGGSTKQDHCYYDWHRVADELIERASEHAESFRNNVKDLIAHGDYQTETQYTEKAIISIFGLYGNSVDEYLAGRLKFIREIKEAVGKAEESGLQRQRESREYNRKEDSRAKAVLWGVVIVALVVWWLVK